MLVRPYLRASSKSQNSNRSRAELERFVEAHGLTVAHWYYENESGATLQRKVLFELIHEAKKGDVILLEQVDRLHRLNAADWETLKEKLSEKQIRVVALDLPTSFMLLKSKPLIDGVDFNFQMLTAVNSMMLDMLSAISRKDYEDRRRRQAQGIANAVAAQKYKGRKPDDERNAAIIKQLELGTAWSDICKLTGCSRSTLSRLNKQRSQLNDERNEL